MVSWEKVIAEAELLKKDNPTLKKFIENQITQHITFNKCIAGIVLSKLSKDNEAMPLLKEDLLNVLDNLELISKIKLDLSFIFKSDPACNSHLSALLFYKGFHALCFYRIGNFFWKDNKNFLGLFFQSKASELFGIDIHPAAEIEPGVLIDHGTGVVIGETAIIGQNVSIFQGVTLGGKGHEIGKRHPTVHEGATIYASSTVLGNIVIGKNSIVAAGSLVLKDVAEGETVAGIPARKVRNLNHHTQDWDPGKAGL
jgi:serine O-acetyltransferase